MREIKVVSGTNCRNCETLYEVVKLIVEKRNVDAKVEKVIDIREVLKYGVMETPLLIVDGELKHFGTPLPAPKDIEKFIME